MNFLAPAFLAGIAAVAVPILIHLINRERKVVIEFPSIEDARAWYHGDAYQELAKIRREASSADFVLVEGVG